MRVHRVAVVGALLCAFSVAPAVSGAPSAQADQFDCTFYAFTHGYGGKIVDIGCAYGERGQQVLCEGSLRIAGVPDGISSEACRLATLP